jgi:transposase
LWRELHERGYPGSLRMVWLWVALRRERNNIGRAPARPVEVSSPAQSSTVANLPASRRLVWLLLHPVSELELDEQRLRQRLLQLPDIDRAYELAQRFLALIRQRQVDALQPWINACRDSGIAELSRFAQGLQYEFPIIQAALRLPFSNGVTQGHVNRLKFIKRSMYGRANFDLLRLRVLAA